MTKNSNGGRPRIHADTPQIDHKRFMDRFRYYNDDTLKVWAKYAYANARRRARESGLDFAITMQDIIAKARQTTHCPVLRVLLEYERGRTTTGQRQYAASIDRVDNTKGYTPDNIHVLSVRANTLKSNCTLMDMIAMGIYASSSLRGVNAVA